jgi:tripartite-type tricarboxylate transporter receptor subunit TctC
MNRRNLIGLPIWSLAGACLSSFSAAAIAQEWPTRPIHIIASSAAGSTPDALARMLAQRLSPLLKVPVIVENKSGASGTIAGDFVSKAAADGHTLLLTDAGTWAINPHLMKRIPYDPRRDLAPVVQLGSAPMFLVTSSTIPVTNVKELIAFARSRSYPLPYGSAGNGSIHHLAGEQFKATAGFKALHVPYRGAPQLGVALYSGEVEMAFMGYTNAAAGLAAGKVRILGAATPSRLAAFPEIPTIEEQGLKGFEMSSQIGIQVPARTPPDIVRRLEAALLESAQSPEVIAAMGKVGLAVKPIGAAKFSESIAADNRRFESLVKSSGASIE